MVTVETGTVRNSSAQRYVLEKVNHQLFQGETHQIFALPSDVRKLKGTISGIISVLKANSFSDVAKTGPHEFL